MLMVALAWLFVVGLYAVAQVAAPQGSAALALLTFVGAGVLPLALVGYLIGAPGRRRRRRAAEASAADPDAGSHAAGDPVAPE